MAAGVRTVAEREEGLRLDRWFKTHFPGLGHGALQKMIRTGQVRVDGGRARADMRLGSGQTIRIPPH
ncbi:MAG: RluA family pseudouridine synthase, partial [Rhodobiaceae bacterium]|nr:RluA family pseudouridine synthase [Rhodobiaceae bacterium]